VEERSIGFAGARWVPVTPAWWQRGVIYQIYPWSFADASGDGVGDLRGIRDHAEYLAWLGVDAVWLSPIFPSPGLDLGYDVSDFQDVDPRFGSLRDFDELVAALHAVDLRLILDLVPNHTSDRHPWFEESRRDRMSPAHDWYVWRDPRPDGRPPNNWESYFGGPAWTFLDPPGRWYLHSFDPGQPDLNWDNPAVRDAIRAAMRFWLDRGVDGFRVDVLWLLGKDPEMRDNPPNPGWREGVPDYLRLRRVYSEDGPRAHEYAQFLRAVVDEYPDRVMIGEVVLPPDRAVAYYGTELPEAHMPHNFALVYEPGLTDGVGWSADGIRSAVEHYESVMPRGAWPNWLLGDHDFSRVASRLGPERARVAQMLLLTLRGTPTCYYGDELGLVDAPPGTRGAVSDPQARTGEDRDRLVARTPMPWTTGPYGGFSTAEPWLPMASDDPALTVERQRHDPGSLLNLFRALIGLRRDRPALAVGAYRSLPAPEDVFSFERWHPDGAVHIHLNLGSSPREVDLGGGRVLLSTAGPVGDRAAGGPTLALAGYEGVVVDVGRRET
jgi:alpha-glucosidase